jgi:SAM-dependent methyltransferase
VPYGLKRLAKVICQFLGCQNLIARASLDRRPVNLSHLDASPEALSKDVTYALEVGFNMLNWLKEVVPLRNKTVLEIGPGTNFGPILFLACHGAVPIVADRFLVPWDPEYHPRFYRAYRADLIQQHPGVNPGPIDRLLEAGSYPEEVLRRVTSGAELLGLPNNSVDIILSNAVFEHLEDHSKAFSELFRITKPGGWGFHQVDFRDHRSFERPLEHLLMPREKFDRLAKECFRECGTCLRHYEMIKLFQDCGFELKDFTCNYFATPEYLENFLPRLRKSRRSPYRDVSEEQLRALSGFFTLHKLPQEII